MTEPVKTLDDISDNTVNNRDESFITPSVADAPPRSIDDNETAIDANATDKSAPAKQILKDTVKGELPSTTPSGPPPHGNLRDEEKNTAIADEVSTTAVDEVDHGGIDALRGKLEGIIALKPKIDEISSLIDELKKVAAHQEIHGGDAEGVPDSALPRDEVIKGQHEEMEHTSSPRIAKQISKDHVSKDEHYYDKLEKIEHNGVLDPSIMQKPVSKPMSRREIMEFYLNRAKEQGLQKIAEIDVLTGAPGAGKTTAAKQHAANYDLVLHGDLPLKLTNLQRREAVVSRIREAMRSHNMGKRVLLDSAPRQLKRDYQPLLTAAKRVIILDVPNEMAAEGFGKRTKASPEKSMRVVETAGPTLTDLRNDPRTSTADRDTIGAALKKVAAAVDKPLRRRVEVIITDGLNVYAVEKPFTKGGIWFPGGGVDGPEEKFADAAAREVKEETGIIVDEIHRMAEIDPVTCIWAKDANTENPKWAEKAKRWRGDKTYFYLATVKAHGKITGDDPMHGTWTPFKTVLSRLMASIPFDNKGWKPLTKARYHAVFDAAPSLRVAPRAA